MLFIEICFLLLLIFVAVNTLYRTHTSMQALRWHQFFGGEINHCCEGIGFIGCSVIYYKVSDISEIEQLLSCTYNRYEVIVIIDHTLQAELFATIVKHYRMARVNHPQHTAHALPEVSLYRSTARNFRRLAILDYPTENKYQAINDAISITSYDYIIPLCSPYVLLPHAIDSVVITLSDSSARHTELLYNDTLAPCYVFQRDSLIMRGGLSHEAVQRIPHNLILKSRVALARKSFRHRSPLITWLMAMFIVATCTAIAFFISTYAAIAYGLTFILLYCLSELMLRQWSEENCSARAVLYQIGNLIRFFRSIKFNIS